jgi:hypothetical protein
MIFELGRAIELFLEIAVGLQFAQTHCARDEPGDQRPAAAGGALQFEGGHHFGPRQLAQHGIEALIGVERFVEVPATHGGIGHIG